MPSKLTHTFGIRTDKAYAEWAQEQAESVGLPVTTFLRRKLYHACGYVPDARKSSEIAQAAHITFREDTDENDDE